MIDRVVALCVDRRGIVWLVAALVAAYGAWCWGQLPLEAYPDIADTSSQVVTQVDGLAAEEVERQITVPLEREIMGTPGMEVMRSKSTFGLSLITVVFRDGTDDYWARQRLTERIAAVTLPYNAQPALDPLTSPIGEIYRYTLESSTRSLRELSELQTWKVVPRLKQVAGIADVANFGGLTTQFMLELDPARLVKYGIGLTQITQAITANNASAGGSIVDRGEQGFVVRGVGLIGGLADLGNVVVIAKGGIPVLVKDLGTVTLGQQERRGILGKDGDPDTVEGIVLLLKGENPSTVLDGVHAAVRELNEQILPKDVKVVPYLDRSSLVEATLRTVSRTLLEGMGLVGLVLLLYFGSPRAAAIVALTVPLALLTAFIFMHHLKIPANLLSLGAIDFGIVVDGAIVMMEAVLHEFEAGGGRGLEREDVLRVARRLAGPIFFGMVVIITAYLPLFLFQRIEYKLFAPMAWAIGFALFGALVVSLTLIPGLAWVAFRRLRRLASHPVQTRVRDVHGRVLAWLVGRRGATLAAFVFGVAAVGTLGATVGRDFLPYLDEGSIWLQVMLPPGISLTTATGMADALRKASHEFPEVASVVTQLGRNDDGTDPWTPSHIEAAVVLKHYADWTTGRDKQALIAALAARYARLPGTEVGFSQPMIDGVLDKLAGAHSDLVVKVYGDDFFETRRIGEAIVATLRAVPGAADVMIDQEPPLPQVRIEVDRAAAARYGINAGDIADLIGTGIGGKPVGQLYIDERHYGIAVRFASATRADPGSLGDLVLTAPNGAHVPLAQVATIRLDSGEATITREMGHRHLTVRLDLRGRDLGSFLADAQRRLADQVRYDHARFRATWGGQFENQQRAQARLALIGPVVLALMFVLLFAQFRNLRQPAMILATVPLGALGGLAALHLRGMTLNVSSAVGFIALFGVAVMDAILMVSTLNRLCDEMATQSTGHDGGALGPVAEARTRTSDGEASRDEALRTIVLAGARERVRPVLTTATVAALGLLPAALATGLGSDVQRPLATVVVAGLVTATGLTLVWLPALYFLIERAAKRRTARDASVADVPGSAEPAVAS